MRVKHGFWSLFSFAHWLDSKFFSLNFWWRRWIFIRLKKDLNRQLSRERAKVLEVKYRDDLLLCSGLRTSFQITYMQILWVSTWNHMKILLCSSSSFYRGHCCWCWINNIKTLVFHGFRSCIVLLRWLTSSTWWAYFVYINLQKKRQGTRESLQNMQLSLPRDGKKSAGPEIHTCNAHKLFPSEGLPRKRKKQSNTQSSVHEMVQAVREKKRGGTSLARKTFNKPYYFWSRTWSCKEGTWAAERSCTVPENTLFCINSYHNVLRMETGLPTKEVFQIVVN